MYDTWQGCVDVIPWGFLRGDFPIGFSIKKRPRKDGHPAAHKQRFKQKHDSELELTLDSYYRPNPDRQRRNAVIRRQTNSSLRDEKRASILVWVWKARGGWNEWEGSGEITGGASTPGGRRSCDYPKTRGYVKVAGDNSDGSYNRSEGRRETWLCRGMRESVRVVRK
jgi:hypothetical protein